MTPFTIALYNWNNETAFNFHSSFIGLLFIFLHVWLLSR
uniref:Cytochrome b n=1 Tax=Parascaris equorum TaxID=6256 RepID=A0A914R411_PAREQ